MTEEKELKEALVAYDAEPPDLVEPIILKRDGQPVFAVLPFEEYRRLRDMASTEHQRSQAAWARLNALLEEVHSRPTDLTPDEIEAEITAAFNEVRKIRYGNRGSD